MDSVNPWDSSTNTDYFRYMGDALRESYEMQFKMIFNNAFSDPSWEKDIKKLGI